MGVNFDKDLRIAGYRPALFKKGLLGFLRTQSPANFIDLRSVFPQRRDGAIIFEECLDRGLIKVEADGFAISEAGEAFARARARARTPLAGAQKLLGEFLNRVEALNADPHGVRYVEQVWIFGSLIRQEATVGDIDAALVTERRPKYQADYKQMLRHLDEVLTRYPNAPTTRGLLWSAEHWVTNQALFGAKRHPLLAGVQTDIGDLVKIGAPCRLVYDRSRGGRVNDPVLARHPQSRGTRDGVAPRQLLTGFPLCELRPMDGRWIAGYQMGGDISPYHIFRGWTDEAHKLFPAYPQGLTVVGQGRDLSNNVWKPRSVKEVDLDGRHAIALINADASRGTSVILRRRVTGAERGAWTLDVRFERLELYRRRKHIDLVTLPDLAAAASLIIAVDAERIIRRAAESNQIASVCIALKSEELTGDPADCLVAAVRTHLEARDVRLEPIGWSGPKAVIA